MFLVLNAVEIRVSLALLVHLQRVNAGCKVTKSDFGILQIILLVV